MTTKQTDLSPAEQQLWCELVGQGITRSISGLSEMVGADVTTYGPIIPRRIAVKDAAQLVGGPEEFTVAVYLRVGGCATGHLILIFKPKTAFELVDMLMGFEAGTTVGLGEMEQSALGEMGNIMGSFFLNALADATGLPLLPSPPAVMMDMAGSILDAALAEILMEADEILVVDTVFGTADRQIHGTFLTLPSGEMVRALLQRDRAS